MCLISATMGQLKATVKCDPFDVDILNGKVNGLKADVTMHDIKDKFPCFTGSDEEGASKCGGGVYFKDKDLFFYTNRDYIEIGPKFKGKMSIPLIGAKRNTLFKWLGNPKIKDETWDAFQTSYGTLVLHYDKTSKVSLIQFSTKGSESLSLCQ